MGTPSLTTKPTAVGASFAYAFYDVLGNGTIYAPAHVSLNAAGAVVNPATEDTLQQVRALLAAGLTVEWTAETVGISSIPLPPNAATEATQGNVLAAVDQLIGIAQSLSTAAEQATMLAALQTLHADLASTGPGAVIALETLAELQGISTALGNPVQAGGAVVVSSIPDGGIATIGAMADAAATTNSVSGSVVSWLRGIFTAVVGIGAVADAAVTSGAGSVIALLKGLLGYYAGVNPTTRSIAATVAATSSPLFQANATRRKWFIQAPMTADVWVNPLGGAAGVGAIDCFRIAAGASAHSDGYACEIGAFNYYCATGGLVLTAWEG